MWIVNEEFVRRALHHHAHERGVLKFYWRSDEPVGRITTVSKWQKVRFAGSWVLPFEEETSALNGGCMFTNAVIVRDVQFCQVMDRIAEERYVCVFFFWLYSRVDCSDR